jgi:hypothetical protein
VVALALVLGGRRQARQLARHVAQDQRVVRPQGFLFEEPLLGLGAAASAWLFP